MSILITGGAGFIGSHLAEELVSVNNQITIVDNFSRGRIENISHLKENGKATIIEGDMRDKKTVKNVMEGKEKVYHLAAETGGVGYLQDRPANIISNNDLINKNIFDACVSEGIERIVYAGSSMVYSETNSFPSREEDTKDIPPPRGSYGFQKLNGEYYCRSFAKQYGLEYSIARIFNAIGPRDWPGNKVGYGHVVPDLVKKIVELRQNPVKVKGTGKQTRCFLDIRDLVRGLIFLMEKTNGKNETFNLGSNKELTILELVRKIWKISGRKKELKIETEEPFEKDVKRRIPNIGKAEKLLGWKPKISLDKALEKYISSYKRKFLNES